MKDLLSCNIIGPDLQFFLFEDESRKYEYTDEAEALRAILDGTIETLPWFLDNKKENAVHRPVCAGHIYSDPHSKGPRQAKVMVIGKMPRPADITDDRCFSADNSKAGEYFANTAAEFGMDISGWYVTHLFKTTHPHDEDRGTTLPARWLKESFPILQYEIRLVEPEFILVFGAESVKSLFGNNAKITKLTGTVLDYEYTDMTGGARTAKCVCCTAPQAVIRSSDAKEAHNYRTAFKLFCDTVRGDSAVDAIDHFAVRTIEEWRILKSAIQNECTDGLLAIDCEWNGDHPQNKNWWLRTIQFSWAHGVAAALVIHDVNRNPLFSEEEMAEIIADFQELWMSYVICGHFLDADAAGLIGGGFLPSIVDMPWIASSAEEYREWVTTGQPCMFDTALAAHAYCETDEHSLTAQFMLRCPGVPRYDTTIDVWKAEFAKANKIKVSEIDGYGECPDEVLIPYGCYDADVTRRLAVYYRDHLHKDPSGLDCWPAYTNSMNQWLPFLEINTTGIEVDRDRLRDLTDLYGREADRLVAKIRESILWPAFNLNSHYQMRELLFGEEFNGAKKTGPLRPDDAKTLRITPLYDTANMLWEKALEEKGPLAVPAANSRSLRMLATDYMRKHETAKAKGRNDNKSLFTATVLSDLRNAKILRKALSYVLKEPEVEDDGSETERGLSAYICDDGRIRTHLYQTLDSGRAASARPAMQNISKRREEDYQRIVGDRYIGPLRSILKAEEGHMLVWADFQGAELHALGVLSGDEALLNHVSRNTLPEDDPNFYDLHSQIAVSSFRLQCEPTKAGLKSIKKAHLRIVAKSIIFGLAYGRGAAAIAEAVKEEGVSVTVGEVRQVMDVVKTTYSQAMQYLEEAASRAYDPGWMSGVCKRYRRKPMHGYLSGDKLVDLGRVFKNFGPQNYVAESMNKALRSLFDYRLDREDDLDYQILLQVHDEVLLSVPYKWVSFVVDEVLPYCMRESVAVYPRNLDGVIDRTRGPYRMGIDITVGFSYGIGLKDWRETCTNLLGQ